MKISRTLAAGAAILASGLLAHAAGLWETLPQVGQTSFCAAIGGSGPTQGGITGQGAGAPVAGTATFCAQTVPGGPGAMTGTELIPADTGLPGGAPPQTVTIPSTYLASTESPRNALIGGDFTTNPWQRGTTFTSLTPTAATMTADRWYAYSSANTVTITKQTGAADTVPAAGLLASMRVNRPSGTNTTAICVGQVLDAKASARFLGNNAVFSFFELAGAGFLSTTNNIIPTIAYYTAADSATPGTNTGTFATSPTTPITGYTAVATTTISTTTTWTRYSISAAIPLTNAAGTAITGVGVSICTPVYPASTGVAGDWFEIAGAQLEAGSASLVAPRGFEKRPPALEENLAYYYSAGAGLGLEIASQFYQGGGCVASGNANFGIIFPLAMRTPPTTATSTLTTGGYSIQTAAAVTAAGTLTIPFSTVQGATLNSTAACTATLPYQLKGTATTGLIIFSAEP